MNNQIVIFCVLLLSILFYIFFGKRKQPWILKYRFKQDVWGPFDIPDEYRINTPLPISEFYIYQESEDNDLGTYPINTKQGALQTIFSSGNGPGVAYEWKSHLNGDNPLEKWFISKLGTILNKIKRIYAGKSADEVKLRISSNPWNFHSHFDCVDNYAVQVYGRKDILLWDRNNIPSDYPEERLLKNLSILNNAQTKVLLERIGINTIHWKTNQGDLFYIPQEWYHKISSINTTRASILLNYNVEGNNVGKCKKDFRHFWRKQSKKCMESAFKKKRINQ